MPSKAYVRVTKATTRKKKTGGKRGNPNRCPTCGRFTSK